MGVVDVVRTGLPDWEVVNGWWWFSGVFWRGCVGGTKQRGEGAEVQFIFKRSNADMRTWQGLMRGSRARAESTRPCN